MAIHSFKRTGFYFHQAVAVIHSYKATMLLCLLQRHLAITHSFKGYMELIIFDIRYLLRTSLS